MFGWFVALALAGVPELPSTPATPPEGAKNMVQVTDRSAWYWSPDKGYLQLTDEGPGRVFPSPCPGMVVFSPDDVSALAVCGTELRMIAVQSGESVARAERSVGPVWFAPDGRHLLVAAAQEDADWAVLDSASLRIVGSTPPRSLYAGYTVVPVHDGWAYVPHDRVEVVGLRGEVLRSHAIEGGVHDTTCALDGGRALAWLRDGRAEVVDVQDFSVRGSVPAQAVSCSGPYAVVMTVEADPQWVVLDAQGKPLGRAVKGPALPRAGGKSLWIRHGTEVQKVALP